jgi:xanthine dehydrogenase molybdenum-binding subunit
MAEHTSIGKRPPRIDALDKVTGNAVFSADINLPQMLYGAVLRGLHGHAEITRIDTSKARDLPGVLAVVTAKDVPGLQNDDEILAPMMPTMAKKKVIFAGQPVAALAATSRAIAEEAIGLIDVEYEVLPSVTDVLEAMKPDAPVIYSSANSATGPGSTEAAKNVFFSFENARGNPEKGFTEADVVLENTFRTQTVHQGFLELRASVATVERDGKIIVWTDNQGIFKARELIAKFVGLPLNRVKVMPIEVGGAFGGKEHQQLSPLCALLALKTGRPVKMVMTRAEVLKATRPAPASAITLRTGVTKDGRITAVEATMIYDFGTSTGMPGLDPMVFGSSTGLSPYRIPNFVIRCFDVNTNKAPSGPYRAPSAAQAAFAVECQMDLMARAIDLDPLEFRLRNIAEDGDPMVNSQMPPFGRIGFRKTLETMRDYLAERGPVTGENRGRGVAAGLWLTGCMGSAAHINVNMDGSFVLVVGSTDVSGTRTTFAQMVADEFDVPLSKVTVVTGDTETAPFSIISAGSMTTRSMGKAIYRACQDVKQQICRKAAGKLGVDAAEVEYVSGGVHVKETPERFVTVTELVEENYFSPHAGPITGRGAGEMMSAGTPVLAVQASDVEVDRETGKVKVLSTVIAQDIGLAVNPMLVEGQIQGAAAQSIGWALSENYSFKDGVMENATLLDYRMPTAADVPFIDTLLVEVNSGLEPYGIRGVGEPPIVPGPAAIANAIHSAAGVRVKELPMTPEAVRTAIKASEAV